ncbi:MAG: hypothetical protein ABSH33_14575 [Steroidobacteraceae bacterium]
MSANPARALPLFARQTGMACLACHTNYPELTHFGRMFKLQGYQLDDGKDIEVTSDEGKQLLSLPAVPNLALFIMSGWVQLGKALPDSGIPGATSYRDGIQFPQQVSLLYGGKIAPHFGAFAQVTYDSGPDTFNIDNTDFRFADTKILPNKTKLTYGVAVTNNPSTEDPYNTTPAFGFPYVPPEIAVPSLTGPVINAALAYQVAGPVFYVLWNEQLYAAFGFFRAAETGSTSPGNPITGSPAPYDSGTANVLAGSSPYWRLSYEYDIDRYALELGTYGARWKVYPGAAAGTALSGLTNNYTDVAGDFQFQFIGEQNISTFKGTYVKENQSLDASSAVGASNPTDWVSYLSADWTYWYQRKYGATVGYISTKGSTDPNAYPSAPTLCAANTCGVAAGTPGAFPVGVTNSANSNPTTNSWITELDYQAWLNVRFTLQYTHYTKFNGGVTNYDGMGRNASDNDTTYLLLWFAL